MGKALNGFVKKISFIKYIKTKTLETVKNRKGFTLTELMVGLALTAVMTGAIFTLFVFSLNMFGNLQEDSEANIILMSVNDRLANDIMLSSEIRCPDENTLVLEMSGGAVYEYSAASPEGSGVLRLNGAPVYGEGFYKGYGLSLNFVKTKENTVKTVITLTGKRSIERTVIISSIS